jgi:hypothetical protein
VINGMTKRTTDNIDTVDRPIFMIGVPRSGTTALSEAISLHADLGWISNYVNRLPFWPQLALLDRVSGASSSGWLLRGKKGQDRRLTSQLRRLLPHTDEAFTFWKWYCGEKMLWSYLIDQTAAPAERARLVHAVHTVLRYQAKQRFFTKFTGPPRIGYLQSLFPEAYFVHVVRDPRATVSSLLKVGFWRRQGGLERPWWRDGLTVDDLRRWEDADRTPAALAAVQWNRIVAVARRERVLPAPERYLEVRYEDFTAAPHDVLDAVCDRLALPASPSAHKYLDSIGKLTNMNFKYRSNLSAAEIGLIEEITREEARGLGYSF